MDVLLERCAGIDVHQETMVVTVRIPNDSGGRAVVTQTFGTMTTELLALRDWLHAHRVTHVAIEIPGCIGGRCITCWKMRSRCC